LLAPVVAMRLTTENTIFEDPPSRSSGRDVICRIAVTASCSVVFREIGFEPSRLNDVTAWTCSSA